MALSKDGVENKNEKNENKNVIFEQVKEFTYLGAVIAKDESCEKDIRHR